ncbi:hypothetical protein NL389_32555, partial [Klebsiella pneumoniae]|nr:hypothetical protein [Klebsiella pneumoniae]
ILLIFAIFRERSNLVEYFANIGAVTAILCFSSLFIGYCIPLLMGIPEKMARACTFEIGIHNSTLAMTIALTVIGSAAVAMPAAVYSIFMYIFAAIFGSLLNRLAPLPAQTPLTN